MLSLNIISYLLEYPESLSDEIRQDLLAAADDAQELTENQRQQLVSFINAHFQRNILDAQSEYSELFDRGRATSLLLFEHVHGESRERGQAMVNLLEHYNQAGLDIAKKELPDHLPLFLEFLSTLPEPQAAEWLQSVSSIFALLGARLTHRQSRYAALFDLLAELAGYQVKQDTLMKKVASEARDDTPAAIDAVWEEEQITFMATEQCGDDQVSTHQRRFSGAVAPQYLHVEPAPHRSGGER